jgi:hypothetical protein
VGGNTPFYQGLFVFDLIIHPVRRIETTDVELESQLHDLEARDRHLPVRFASKRAIEHLASLGVD